MNKSREASNPFYAAVIVLGTAFTITALAYVVALVGTDPGEDGVSLTETSPALRFFDRRGELLMLWEGGGLGVAALLAMALDRWRSYSSSTQPAARSGDSDSTST